jgi:hypothetical protein
MQSLPTIAGAITLSVLLAPTPVPAADDPPYPRNPDDLQVSLNILVALEEGPVICEVTLKNVSDKPLCHGYRSDSTDAFCELVGQWKARGEPMRGGFFHRLIAFGNHTLKPGESESHTFELHPRFRSIPPGKATLRYGWHLHRLAPNHDKNYAFDTKLELLFTRERTKTIEVLPATKENVAAELRRLEAEFDRVSAGLADKTDYPWMSPDPAYPFVHTITGCRHKEFVPLLLRALDRLPSQQLRKQLVGGVYESFSTPQAGFAVLADYLGSEQPSTATELFRFWSDEDGEHKDRKHRHDRVAELKKQEFKGPNAAKETEEARWYQLFLEHDEEQWQTSRRHIDVRLTKEQFARLRAVKNVWVRALLYAHYPDHCPADWIDTLFKDLGQLGRPPARLGELLAALDDNRFAVRAQASAELIKSGSELAFFLWTVPPETLSPEAARRLRLVQDQVGKPALPRLWQRTLDLLAEDPSPQRRKLLEALAAKESRSLIAPAAQQALEEHEKRMREIEEWRKQREKAER